MSNLEHSTAHGSFHSSNVCISVLNVVQWVSRSDCLCGTVWV